MTIAIDVGERYDVLSLLGEGGLGKVYLARDTVAEEQVALKLLNDRAHDDVDLLNFKQQFRTMARLRHPNLCRVHDCGVTLDGALYYTTDYVPGEDLTARIPMSEAALRALLPQLGSVLGYLHQQGFVYGDLKPQNLRVTPDGTLKLLDIERMLRTSDAGAMPKGSLAYMAPEMVKGRHLDSRTDLYALGATCYHLITGEPPYSGSSPLEVLRAHLTRRPRALRHVVDGVSVGLEHAVLRMMAIEPVARYRSVAEALAELGVETDDAGAVTLEGVFVGREGALGELMAALDELREGRGQALWVVGGTGAGKSRLLDELRVLAQLEEVPFYAARAGDAQAPYAPLVDVLRAVLARAPQLPLGAEARAALAHLLPELADGTPEAVLEPLEDRARIQAAIAHVLFAASEPAGLVLALDDWDSADPSSAEALAYLLRNARGTRILLAGARREAREAGRVLLLEPLTQREAMALASSMLGEEAPADFVAGVNRWTGGSPGHFRRAIAHLVRVGALTRHDGHWRFPAELPAFDADFRATLIVPLASLPALALQVAQAASVAGSEADLKMLVDLCALEDEALFAALDELAAREVLRVRNGQARFVTGGLEEALYDSIPEPRRLELHAAVAEHLHAREERPEVGTLTALARHLLRSRQIERALSAVLRAADANMAVFGVEAARKLLRDALALTAAEPEAHARARRDVFVRLAQVERWRGDLDALDACLDEGLPLAERLEERGPLLRLLLLRGVGQTLRMAPASLQSGAETLERACALAEEPAFEARCRFSLAQNYFYQGRMADSRTAFERASRVAEAAGQPFWHAKSLAFLGYLQATGLPAGREPGFARLAEAAEIQTRLGDRYGRSFTAALQGDALLQAWRLREAEEAFSTQLVLDEALGVGEDLVTSLANLATVQALAGRLRDASETCARALPSAIQHAHPVRVLILAVRAFVRAGLGDLPNALSDLRELSEPGGGYMALHAAPFQVAAWTRLGHAGTARALAEQSLAALKTQPNPLLEGQLNALLGDARLAAGDEAGAAAALAQCPDPAEASLASFFARRLRAMLHLRAGALDAACEAAESARLLAEEAGAWGFTAEMIALAAQCALAAGRADAPSRFRAAQALADREGLPLLRAIALHGQSSAETSPERGDVMAAEAQQILRTLAHGLPPRDRDAFLAMPECARMLEERPVQRAPLD
ncbi:MAG TPA: protein kinase, partial [Oscillatoriaceae cyanobacterium]